MSKLTWMEDPAFFMGPALTHLESSKLTWMGPTLTQGTIRPAGSGSHLAARATCGSATIGGA